MSDIKWTPIYTNEYGRFFLPYDEAMFSSRTAALRYGKKHRRDVLRRGKLFFAGDALPLRGGEQYPHFPLEQHDAKGQEIEPLFVAAISGALREMLEKAAANKDKTIQGGKGDAGNGGSNSGSDDDDGREAE